MVSISARHEHADVSIITNASHRATSLLEGHSAWHCRYGVLVALIVLLAKQGLTNIDQYPAERNAG
jgi:hypothetical protein